jgi:PAS domain S-box-containing protein
LILVTDRRGRFIQVSPSCLPLLGYTPQEMIGRLGGTFIYPADLEPTRNEMRAARRGRAMRLFDCRYVHKDGHPVSLTWTGVWSEEDEHHFFIGRDMTEVNRIGAQLRQAQKMEVVGQLTGGLAHDFNNILTVILGGIEAIEEEDGLSADVRSLVREVGTAALRASELTRQLLAFSRRQSLRPEVLNLNELVVALGKLLRRTLGEDIQIDQRLSVDLGPTNIDRAQFESALLNLCVNARDAMPDGGRLMIETADVELDHEYETQNPEAKAGSYAMLAVTDTGIGMSKETIERVFEPFFTTKEVGKGSGLGLSMVYGFIKQSQGHIKVYSEIGQGTSIKIYLPLSARQERDDTRPAAPPPPRGTEHVLLVEDDPKVRGGVRRQLVSLGYTVTEAESGDAALDVLGSGHFTFDVVLTDMVMPGRMTGMMLLDAVSRQWPGVRTILMSGYTENVLIQEGRLGAGVRLLIKPFLKAELAQILRETLEEARRPALQ